MHVAWTLTDHSTGSPVTYSFPINPNTHRPPGRRSNVTTDRALAPNGVPIIYQGRDEVGTGEFGGVINTQTQYNDMQIWGTKREPMVLTDDQGRVWNILITEFTIDRLRRINNWRHDYTIKYIEVS